MVIILAIIGVLLTLAAMVFKHLEWNKTAYALLGVVLIIAAIVTVMDY